MVLIYPAILALSLLLTTGCTLGSKENAAPVNTGTPTIPENCSTDCNGNLVDVPNMLCTEYNSNLYESGFIYCTENCIADTSQCEEALAPSLQLATAAHVH